ncbi:GNAT family N-acetyltransferase [Aspergillus undulatus]|uniref:GNAT family N-acetyltransferase n=1 Tax=Aspergillus undulatus TaxID=1810928 RepID=UPI003CCE42E3
MEFTLTAALPTDAPAITSVYFSAFTNDLSNRIMPNTPDVAAFQTALFQKAAEDSQAGRATDLIKIVGTSPDQSQDPVIAGFALWKFFEADSDDEKKEEETQWPQNSDAELCESFFSKVDGERRRAVGDQPHYYLNMLAVHPDYGRQGLGGRLLKWGLDRADQEGRITFISASPTGRGLYEKHGARAVNNYEVVPGYRETSMIRPVAGLMRG